MIIVLVHGWSVTDTSSYGGLPARLTADSAAGRIPGARIHHVYLGQYVSFSDEIRLADIARAFEAAVQRELGADIAAGQRLAIITHSTGGPVIRHWWWHFYRGRNRDCPMRHLVMLAPANFGSALAQLGKTRIADLAAWFQGVEPGRGVLDWLEHGSPEAWALNRDWIDSSADADAAPWQFVLTGQRIDRRAYDHVNSYTGEPGSDGAVRVAAANLDASHVHLEQARPAANTSASTVLRLDDAEPAHAPATAFALIPGRSHAGERMGILRSIADDGRSHPTYSAIVRCLQVDSADDYARLRARFESDTERVRSAERLERSGRVFRREHFHDAHALLMVRIRDDDGLLPERFDLKLTGSGDNPDNLPSGFIVDVQRNRRDAGVLTFHLNADRALGADAVIDRQGEQVRAPLPGMRALGLQLLPRPRDGYVSHAIAQLNATPARLANLVRRDAVVMVDLVLRRLVRSGTFYLNPNPTPTDFKRQPRGRVVP